MSSEVQRVQQVSICRRCSATEYHMITTEDPPVPHTCRMVQVFYPQLLDDSE